MTSKQKLALGLVGAAIAAMLFCALTNKWFSISMRGGSINIGLRSIESCDTFAGKEECTSRTLKAFFEDMRDDDDAIDTWLTASSLTFYLAFASILALGVVGFFGFKQHDKVGLVAKITLLVLILTILCAVVVLAKRPPRINASMGVFLFMVGGMTGVIGAHLLGNPETYVEVERDPSIPKL